MELAKIKSLINIADRAIQADTFEREAKFARGCLNDSYQGFKDREGFAKIDRDTPEWDRMLIETKAEYDASEDAKRLAKNAKRRLQTAIQRHREGGTA